MTDKQLKAILTMLAISHTPISRMSHEIDGSWHKAEQVPIDERIIEAEKLAEKVMGRMG